MTEEEGQQERTDVRPIDIRIGHDDDLAVAELGDIEVATDAATEGADECADFFEAQDLVDACAFDIENLTFERQDGLCFNISALRGRATRRVAFDNKEFSTIKVFGFAIPELVRHRATIKGSLAPGELASFASRFACLCCDDALEAEFLGLGRVLFEPVVECFLNSA